MIECPYCHRPRGVGLVYRDPMASRPRPGAGPNEASPSTSPVQLRGFPVAANKTTPAALLELSHKPTESPQYDDM